LHLSGPLGHGRLEGPVLSCPWHGWQYDVRTGKNEFDHAIQLQTFEVRIEDGEVKVAV
jgi:nitrite reductase/ring-hydroxylating ferredoxin subunit